MRGLSIPSIWDDMRALRMLRPGSGEACRQIMSASQRFSLELREAACVQPFGLSCQRLHEKNVIEIPDRCRYNNEQRTK